MVDFRKPKVLTPAERAAQEDGRRAQGRVSTVSKFVGSSEATFSPNLRAGEASPSASFSYIACDMYVAN